MRGGAILSRPEHRLPDGWTVGLEQCKGWLQDSVYGGWFVRVEHGWVKGKPGIVVSR
jgi:hypothetical protein